MAIELKDLVAAVRLGVDSDDPDFRYLIAYGLGWTLHYAGGGDDNDGDPPLDFHPFKAPTHAQEADAGWDIQDRLLVLLTNSLAKPAAPTPAGGGGGPAGPADLADGGLVGAAGGGGQPDGGAEAGGGGVQEVADNPVADADARRGTVEKWQKALGDFVVAAARQAALGIFRDLTLAVDKKDDAGAQAGNLAADTPAACAALVESIVKLVEKRTENVRTDLGEQLAQRAGLRTPIVVRGDAAQGAAG